MYFFFLHQYRGELREHTDLFCWKRNLAVMQPAGVASAFSIASLTAGLSHHHPQPYPHPAAVTTSAMMCAAGYPPAALPLPYATATTCQPVSYAGSLALPPLRSTCAGRGGGGGIEMPVLPSSAGSQCALNNPPGSAGGGTASFTAHHPSNSYSRQCTGDVPELNRNIGLLSNSRQGLVGVTDLNIPRWNSYGPCLEPGITSAISPRVPNGHDSTSSPLLRGGGGGGGHRDYVESLQSPNANYCGQTHSPTGKIKILINKTKILFETTLAT